MLINHLLSGICSADSMIYSLSLKWKGWIYRWRPNRFFFWKWSKFDTLLGTYRHLAMCFFLSLSSNLIHSPSHNHQQNSKASHCQSSDHPLLRTLVIHFALVGVDVEDIPLQTLETVVAGHTVQTKRNAALIHKTKVVEVTLHRHASVATGV